MTKPLAAPLTGVVKNKSTEKGREFWDHVETVAAQVREVAAPLPEPTDRIIARLAQIERDPYPMPKTRQTFRYEDMSPGGRLTLHRQQDGDMIVTAMSDDFEAVTVEFCTPGGGGGQSARTHRALVALMVAMEMDDAERKQVRDVER